MLYSPFRTKKSPPTALGAIQSVGHVIAKLAGEFSKEKKIALKEVMEGALIAGSGNASEKPVKIFIPRVCFYGTIFSYQI